MFQQRLKKAEEWESFIGEKEEGFDYALIEDYWPGEDVNHIFVYTLINRGKYYLPHEIVGLKDLMFNRL